MTITKNINILDIYIDKINKINSIDNTHLLYDNNVRLISNKNNRNIPIYKLDDKKLKYPNKIIITGREQRKKIILIEEIINKSNKKSNGLFISSKEDTYYYFKDKYPSANLVHISDYDLIDEYIIDANYIVVEIARSDSNFWHNDLMNKLLNIDKLLVVSTENILKIPTSVNLIFDYIYLLVERNNLYKKRLYVIYGKLFESLEHFINTFTILTQNNRVMVINNIIKNDNLIKRLNWF